jgi:hypothetical protein
MNNIKDTKICPICQNDLKSIKRGTTIERNCIHSPNHSLQFFVDQKTKEINLIKFSLNPQYSIFVEINYKLGNSRVICLINGQPQYINVPKILEPDFPELKQLKKKVDFYVIMS